MGSAALNIAVALPKYGHSNFSEGMNEVLQKKNFKDDEEEEREGGERERERERRTWFTIKRHIHLLTNQKKLIAFCKANSMM